jgi:hypothetical protein
MAGLKFGELFRQTLRYSFTALPSAPHSLLEFSSNFTQILKPSISLFGFSSNYAQIFQPSSFIDLSLLLIYLVRLIRCSNPPRISLKKLIP